MLNTRYIEIDSTFRNRSEWPEPAQFELLISQTGNKDAKTALDPIAFSTPIIRWVPNSIDFITGTVLSGYNTSYDEFALTVSGSFNASKTIDYYNGCPITVSGSNVRIVSWKYLSSTSSAPFLDYFNVTITPKLSTIPSGTVDFGNVSDYSFINGVYIPNGLREDNFYIGYYIFNETKVQTRKVLRYDGTTKIAIVDSSISTWASTDTLVLRETNPSEIITFPYFNNNLIQLPFTNTTLNGDYIGNFIRLQTGGTSVYKITNHINLNPISYEIINPPILRLKFPMNVLSRTANAYSGFGIIINSIQTISTWTFVKTVDTYDFFDLTIGIPIPAPITNLEFPKILTINGSIGTYSALLSTYELLPFTRDNFSPFNFTGGVLSHQEAVCYEIELVNLTLPNLPLKTGTRIPFLPYIYVEFQSYTSGNYNIIYSNNPKATRMIFRVAIDDISNPEVVPFIKLKSEMVQTLKFRPTDNFKFGVYLPDGSLFSTIYPENYSPLEPNPLVQVSALFSIKRCQ